MHVKLSELPVNSVIESDLQGIFMKTSKKVWTATSSHCSDCVETVHEDGVDLSKVGPYVDDWSTEQTAEEWFVDYKVLAIGVDNG